MKNVLIYLGLIVTIVALYGFAYTIADQKSDDGKKIFVDNKCSMCHTVTSAGERVVWSCERLIYRRDFR